MIQHISFFELGWILKIVIKRVIAHNDVRVRHNAFQIADCGIARARKSNIWIKRRHGNNAILKATQSLLILILTP